MNRIDAPTLLTIIYVLVDDWYQEQAAILILKRFCVVSAT